VLDSSPVTSPFFQSLLTQQASGSIVVVSWIFSFTSTTATRIRPATIRFLLDRL